MKILVADDQPRVRFALRILLEQQPGWKVTGEAQDAAELIPQVETGNPDLLLLDGELPGLDQSSLLEHVRSLCPEICIIALSESRRLTAGGAPLRVEGIASKTHSPDHLLSTIKNCIERRLPDPGERIEPN